MNDDILLETKSVRNMPYYLVILMIISGMFFMGASFSGMWYGKPFSEVFHGFIIGFVMIYGSSFKKNMYITHEGIVRETRSCFFKNHDLLEWHRIKHVMLVSKKNAMLGLFEQGTTGWKVVFAPEQKKALQAILKDYIPKVDVEIVN